MKLLQNFLVCAIALIMFGCDSSPSYVAPEPGPELHGFHMVDSFGTDSEFDHDLDLELDPYVDEGVFELYWDVDSREDYTVVISVNDRPGLQRAVAISSDFCGAGLSCDDNGMQVCQYTPYFEVGCGFDLTEANFNLVLIEDLFADVPDWLYFNIEICGVQSGLCEVNTLPVIAH